MPKRTNDFQKLVLRINQHLATSSATVTESKMLWDEDGKQNREVDIYIEDKVGPYEIRIGVECTAQKSGITLDKIEQLHAKHKRLGINRTVIVSQHGFSESAKNYARKMNIETLGFGKAMGKSWPVYLQKVKQMTVVHKKYRMTGIRYDVDRDAFERGFKSTQKVEVISHGKAKYLSDFAVEQAKSGRECIMARTASEAENQNIGAIIEKRWEFEPALVLRDEYGCQTSCRSVTGLFEVIASSHRPIEMSYGEYADREIVYGGVKNLGPIKEANITLSPTVGADGEAKYEMTINITDDTHQKA